MNDVRLRLRDYLHNQVADYTRAQVGVEIWEQIENEIHPANIEIWNLVGSRMQNITEELSE